MFIQNVNDMHILDEIKYNWYDLLDFHSQHILLEYSFMETVDSFPNIFIKCNNLYTIQNCGELITYLLILRNVYFTINETKKISDAMISDPILQSCHH